VAFIRNVAALDVAKCISSGGRCSSSQDGATFRLPGVFDPNRDGVGPCDTAVDNCVS
jgi:hypothetical protein